MDQGWLGCYTLFLGWWMAGLVTWEVYKQLFKAGNQNTKSKKNDTDSFERVTFEEARIGLLFDIDIEHNSCSHCGKNAKELTWFKFNSPAEAWRNLAGRSGYYSYCPDCDCPSEDFITAMN